jgi:hypothetical protein
MPSRYELRELKSARRYHAYLVALVETRTGRHLDVGMFSEASPTLAPAMGLSTKVLIHTTSRRSLERAESLLRTMTGRHELRGGWERGVNAKQRAALDARRARRAHKSP